MKCGFLPQCVLQNRPGRPDVGQLGHHVFRRRSCQQMELQEVGHHSVDQQGALGIVKAVSRTRSLGTYLECI